MVTQCGDNFTVYESKAILGMDGNIIGRVDEKFWLCEFLKVVNFSAIKNV
jgi:hypothetical protein